jgi:hypothetical protein
MSMVHAAMTGRSLPESLERWAGGSVVLAIEPSVRTLEQQGDLFRISTEVAPPAAAPPAPAAGKPPTVTRYPVIRMQFTLQNETMRRPLGSVTVAAP